MNRAMFASASGMAAEEQRLDVVADDLSNADVAGFKKTVVQFRSVSDGKRGYGTALAGKHTLFTQGKIVKSGGPFDVAIDGPGFFILRDANGRRVYSRNGEFSRALDGRVVNNDGLALEGIKLPSNTVRVEVDSAGRVLVDTPVVKHFDVGQIRLAVFASPESLAAGGGNTFSMTAASGKPQIVAPESGGTGRIRFGMLERSNVSIMESMMEILSAQRAFEANSKGVQAADEMLRIANNINKGQ